VAEVASAAAGSGKAKAKAVTSNNKSGSSSSSNSKSRGGSVPGNQAAVNTNGAAAAAGTAAGAAAEHMRPEQGGLAAAVAAVAHHPIAELLNQVILLLGYFCMQNPSNQGMLQWGKSPTLLQRLCSVPFPYFSHPELVDVYMPTLLAVSYKHERACEMVEQYISMDVLLQYAKGQLRQYNEQHELLQTGVKEVINAERRQQQQEQEALEISSRRSHACTVVEPVAAAAASESRKAEEKEEEGVSQSVQYRGDGSKGSSDSTSATVLNCGSSSSSNTSSCIFDEDASTVLIWQLGGHFPPALSKLLSSVNHKASCLTAGTSRGSSSSSDKGRAKQSCSDGSGKSRRSLWQGSAGSRSGHVPGLASRFPLQLLPDVVSFFVEYKKSQSAKQGAVLRRAEVQ
jgi:hypothetical protein